jgi:hypothetical protein
VIITADSARLWICVGRTSTDQPLLQIFVKLLTFISSESFWELIDYLVSTFHERFRLYPNFERLKTSWNRLNHWNLLLRLQASSSQTVCNISCNYIDVFISLTQNMIITICFITAVKNTSGFFLFLGLGWDWVHLVRLPWFYLMYQSRTGLENWD